jgi:hypothetical protein
MQPLPPDLKREGKIVEKKYQASQTAVLAEILDYLEQKNASSVDDANIVVAAGHCNGPGVGRGIGRRYGRVP